MCVYVPSNTTVILDGVYLLALSYMFRPLLGHHQAFWRYVILAHCFYIILHLHLCYQPHCYKRPLVLVLQASLGCSVVFGGVGYRTRPPHTTGARGGAVVKTLRYKPEGREIDSRWCQNFSLT
jgi:hypothetical protein